MNKLGTIVNILYAYCIKYLYFYLHCSILSWISEWIADLLLCIPRYTLFSLNWFPLKSIEFRQNQSNFFQYLFSMIWKYDSTCCKFEKGRICYCTICYAQQYIFQLFRILVLWACWVYRISTTSPLPANSQYSKILSISYSLMPRLAWFSWLAIRIFSDNNI